MEHVKKRHAETDSSELISTSKGATSGEERVDAYEATYERDETSGPLKKTARNL